MLSIKLKEKEQEIKLNDLKVKELRKQVPNTRIKPIKFKRQSVDQAAPIKHKLLNIVPDFETNKIIRLPDRLSHSPEHKQPWKMTLLAHNNGAGSFPTNPRQPGVITTRNHPIIYSRNHLPMLPQNVFNNADDYYNQSSNGGNIGPHLAERS